MLTFSMGKLLCLIVFVLMIMMNSASIESDTQCIHENKTIYIDEHPSSLLLAVNEIGNLSCRAHCDPPMSCFGRWIINNTFIDPDAPSVLDEYSRLGYIFTKSKTEIQGEEHIIYLGVNASKINNNSEIQCLYQPIPDHDLSANNVMQSMTARVLVLPSGIEFFLSAVNVNVLFNADGRPAIVEVHMLLPEELCSIQQSLSFILYSLRVEEIQGRLVMSAGPFSNLTSCAVRRLIEPALKETENYTLTVIVGTQSRNITSYKHSFNTSSTSFVDHTHKECTIIRGTDTSFSYQLVVIVSLGLIVFLLISILTTLLLCICISHKRRISRERRLKDTKIKLCKSMIHNPLYDRSGPQYYEIAQFTQPTHPDYDTINTLRRTAHNQQDTPTTDNHLDQPAHSVLRFHSSSTAPDDIMSEPTSSSVPAPSLMGLKKNGQERNKLHLTLSLGSADLRNNHGVVTSESDDNYTILNPIASRQSIARNESFI